MERLYVFLIDNGVWIYIVCAIGIVWYLVEFLRAQGQLSRAQFTLERESAARVRNNALSFIIFLGLLAGFVFYVNNSIAPTLPQELLFPPTPTPNIFSTPLAPPTPLGEENGGFALPSTPDVAATATLPIEGGGELEALEPITDTETVESETLEIPTPFVGCEPNLRITGPLDGSVAFSSVNFVGTANTGESHLYIIELNGPQTAGAWTPTTDQPLAQPVDEGSLGTADLSQWPDGPYLARLRAVDRSGNEVGQCIIQFTLDNR